jgi:hypothetical protein
MMQEIQVFTNNGTIEAEKTFDKVGIGACEGGIDLTCNMIRELTQYM